MTHAKSATYRRLRPSDDLEQFKVAVFIHPKAVLETMPHCELFALAGDGQWNWVRPEPSSQTVSYLAIPEPVDGATISEWLLRHYSHASGKAAS